MAPLQITPQAPFFDEELTLLRCHKSSINELSEICLYGFSDSDLELNDKYWLIGITGNNEIVPLANGHGNEPVIAWTMCGGVNLTLLADMIIAFESLRGIFD